MPACFQLTPKGQTEPQKLTVIDELMCQHFQVVPDAIVYYRGWYDIVGFGLACGKTFAELRVIHPRMVDIIDWLDANYTPNAWHESVTD